MIKIVTFYKFVKLPDYREMREPLLNLCNEKQIKGTILLAEEGINATIAGEDMAINGILGYLREDDRFDRLNVKESFSTDIPFKRMKVKLKKEIVTLRQDMANPTKQVGKYVKPDEWNQLIQSPDVLVIDTRNDYEVKIGSFQGAINPQTHSFTEFPHYVETHLDPEKHPKVAMFCTGGIRCEKASSLMVAKGFKEVYHLEGGILKYLEETPPAESLWEGECFVFDERVALKHGLEVGTYDMCQACGQPISAEDQRSPQYQPNVSCPHCYSTTSYT
jgi:UPF0176 protein